MSDFWRWGVRCEWDLGIWRCLSSRRSGVILLVSWQGESSRRREERGLTVAHSLYIFVHVKSKFEPLGEAQSGRSVDFETEASLTDNFAADFLLLHEKADFKTKRSWYTSRRSSGGNLKKIEVSLGWWSCNMFGCYDFSGVLWGILGRVWLFCILRFRSCCFVWHCINYTRVLCGEIMSRYLTALYWSPENVLAQ